jgi:hypothetical protein
MQTSPLLYTGVVSTVRCSTLPSVAYVKASLGVRTIRMPHIRQKLHLWRRKGIVFRKLELCGEDAAFEWCAFWPLDKGFPQEHVIFGYGARCDAFWRVRGERFVLFEEALCCRVRHGGVSAVARSEGDYGGVARSGVAVCVLAVQA